MLKQTHTVATMEISRAAYDEITQKLRAAGYDHVFDGELIDMTGIGLEPEPPKPVTPTVFVNAEGQRFFKYPDINPSAAALAGGGFVALSHVTDINSPIPAGLSHGDRYTTDDGTPMIAVDTRREPARPISLRGLDAFGRPFSDDVNPASRE